MEKEIDYLSEIVNSVKCIPNVFKIRIDHSDKFIFAISNNDKKTEEWYAVAAIYDSICEIDSQIKYAFEQTIRYRYNLIETSDSYNPFSKLNDEEKEVFYHIENIVFRVSVLWDLLAQLCNVTYGTGLPHDKIHYKRYFEKYSKGEDSYELAIRIKEYMDEEDSLEHETTPWVGNHAFLTEFRNQMTHRVSPVVSSFTKFGMTLRPPALYVMHRALEDYYKVSSFLCAEINKFLNDRKDWMPIGV